MVVDPNGNYLYTTSTVIGPTITSMVTYAIAGTGNLTPVNAPVNLGRNADFAALAFDLSGKHLYLNANQAGGTGTDVLGFNVNPATGALIGSPFVATSATRASNNTLKVDPSGKFLYMTSGGGTTGVDGFSIDPANGQLTHIAGLPVSGGNTSGIGFTIQ